MGLLNNDIKYSKDFFLILGPFYQIIIHQYIKNKPLFFGFSVAALIIDAESNDLISGSGEFDGYESNLSEYLD